MQATKTITEYKSRYGKNSRYGYGCGIEGFRRTFESYAYHTNRIRFAFYGWIGMERNRMFASYDNF